ncbi:right-handed parallel beta-helix repeat-containing protein [Cyclobacterium jeungdonense]|uniref:Right-handed parallel beta-helix repeat-containing protein n=1 Tax=Cyclobacterium jeungdonense TaxID=708087 RepID=A0ABT8C3J5_9BACT|nr:right-handed parallel beta-helix repeat-containing protein [Cyclobacterium jeungdonense]MDN3686607.1 right-handed parallel beta-helix repeat-containing protein [Cyclobacterium jeungdonense]
MRRTHFLLLFLWIGTITRMPAASYYLSSSAGKDTHTHQEAQNPATPWQSLEKLNQFIPQLAPGDSVLLKRGDVFYGTIHLKKSGTKEHPIVYSHYGKGPLPMITGLSELKGWVSHSPGIYFVELPLSFSQIKVLTLDGKPQSMGRFPNPDEVNKGYLIPEKVEGNNQLSHEVFLKNEGWQSAELVLRKNHWVIDRQKITARQGNTITFSTASSYEPKKGYGFFIQNHLNTLDQLGEWYQDKENNRLYVCMEDTNPENYTIHASNVDQLITTLPNTRHVTIEGLHLNGANEVGLYIRGGSFFRFSNSIIENSGENGVLALNMDHLSIHQSEIRNSFNSGIYLRSGNYQATITDNLIENTFMMPGMGQNGDNNGYALFSISDADTIARNTIRNVGYVGIGFRGSKTLIKNNLVDGFCLSKGDGGGIYTYTGNSNPRYTDRKVTGNIVRNGEGAREGTPLQGSDLPAPAEGIYIDDNSNNVLVTDNTVYQISNKGIYLHNAQNIEVSNNLVFDAGYLVFLTDDELGQPLKSIRISNNTLIKKEPHQIGMGIRSASPEFQTIGLSDQNRYVDLTGFGIPFYFQNRATKKEMYHTLESWERETGWEKSTTQITKTINQDLFEYDTKTLTNANFSDAINRIYCTNGCTLTHAKEGNISITGKDEIASLKLDLGPLKNDSSYLLSITASSEGQTIMEAYLRQKGPSYQKLSTETPVLLTNSKNEFKIVIESPREDQDASLILNIYPPKQEINISLLSFEVLKKTPASPSETNFILLSNTELVQKEIKLESVYFNLFGKTQPKVFTLNPYESIFLMRE